MKSKRLGLVPKLICAIVLGVILGQMEFIPSFLMRIPITYSALFSSLLSFIIPLMIVALVIVGISDLTQGAGKLLGLTTLLAYGLTFLGGLLAYAVASRVFPFFIGSELAAQVSGSQAPLSSLFQIPLSPLLDVTGAIVFSFLMGIGISWLRSQGKGETLYGLFQEFGRIINQILSSVIIPGLPLYIFGNFLNMSYTGEVFGVLSVFWKVFLVIIALHLASIIGQFFLAGAVGRKNPLTLIRHQIPAYVTAFGTQSSAATIPVNLESARKNGVSREIREFVVPLCATIYLSGSIITITSIVTAVLLMYGLPHGFGLMAGFIGMLGVAMVAAPGMPGGGIMSALPFMGLIGIDPTGTIGQLLITLYLTQDSFGTSANVSGDNALAVIVDTIYRRFLAPADHMHEETAGHKTEQGKTEAA